MCLYWLDTIAHGPIGAVDAVLGFCQVLGVPAVLRSGDVKGSRGNIATIYSRIIH